MGRMQAPKNQKKKKKDREQKEDVEVELKRLEQRNQCGRSGRQRKGGK